MSGREGDNFQWLRYIHMTTGIATTCVVYARRNITSRVGRPESRRPNFTGQFLMQECKVKRRHGSLLTLYPRDRNGAVDSLDLYTSALLS